MRAYAQKDPLVEYKKEAFTMFEEMTFLVKAETLEKLFKIQLVVNNQADIAQAIGVDSSREVEDDDLDEMEQESFAQAEEQLEALKPKRQRMTFSGPDSDSSPPGAPNGKRSDRRRDEKIKPKKRF